MPTLLEVTHVEDRSPTLRRVWFRSDDLSAFAASTDTDRYVKLVFPKAGVKIPTDVDFRRLREILPPEQMPAVRTYTALYPDISAGTLAIDFVVHGDEGVAGPWARQAQPGDSLVINGPGGAYSPDPTADWHLLIGDESALPAITAALEAMPPGATVKVLALVDSPDHQVDLPGGSDTQWIHRPDTLLAHLESMQWPPGRVHAFVHGEAEEVMKQLRPHLLRVCGVPRADLSISGYWRRGRTEEGFRAWKSELVAEDS